MRYSKELLLEKANHETAFDITWFGVDLGGKIINVSSGGGLWPTSVLDLGEANRDLIYEYFLSIPDISNNIIIEPEVLDSMKKSLDQNHFMNNLRQFTVKGITLFDKRDFLNYNHFEYYLNAAPENFLDISEIDYDIRMLVSMTIIPINVLESKVFDVSDVL